MPLLPGPGAWSIISLNMECGFLESCQPPWSKLYPVAKIWHGSRNTYIVYSSATAAIFLDRSEAFTSLVLGPNFSGLGFFENFKCSWCNQTSGEADLKVHY